MSAHSLSELHGTIAMHKPGHALARDFSCWHVERCHGLDSVLVQLAGGRYARVSAMVEPFDGCSHGL